MVIPNGESAILKKRASLKIVVLEDYLPFPPVDLPSSLEPLHVVKRKEGKSLCMSFKAKKKSVCLAATN